jgi:hypothetical protein
MQSRYCFVLRLLGSLAVLLACGIQGISQDSPAKAKPDKQDISSLIDKLTSIAEEDIGYSASQSGSRFLPLGTGDISTLLLGGPPPASSDIVRDLVKRGATAIPELIKHLDDKRPTKITIKHEGFFGGMFFPDEYDYNQRTTKEPPAGVNRRNRDGGDGDSHTVTVGDLCFVALGQIVNRHFSAVRYQPTACIMINSPTRSEALRSAIKKEWGTLTPEQHKASLIRDFREPDHQERRRGACVRLAYFYPDVMEALVLKQLAEPTYDVFEVQELIRDKLYRAKDAKERKSLFDAFLAKRGTVARQGVLLYLFEDLDTQEADEEKRISPPLKEKYAARACLVELFDYPKDVKSKDRPHISPVEDSEQARFIETLIHDKCRKIGDVVKALFLENANDDYFAPACLRCLANRGYADFLLEQLAKIDPAVSEGTRLYETYIEAITTSDEPSVRAKLFDLLKRSGNEAYFLAALPAIDRSHDKTIGEAARKLLAKLPSDTKDGAGLLQILGERFPKEAKQVYWNFLSTGSANRAGTMCVVLWDDPLGERASRATAG